MPPAPPLGTRRRREIARDWLESLSQSPTPERVKELAPFVGQFPPSSPLGKIASRFVANNQLPAAEDVIAVYLRRQAIRQHRRNTQAGPVPPYDRARLLELIDGHWATHGRGPAWAWLGRQVGLARQDMTAVLRELNNARAVTFTRDPGSLRRTTPHPTS